MSTKTNERQGDPRIVQAIEDLEALVLSRYPAARFEVSEGDDPSGTYLWAAVDVADTDEIMDLVIDHLLDLQVEQRLPVYFIPTPPFQPVAHTLPTQGDQTGRVGGHGALSR